MKPILQKVFCRNNRFKLKFDLDQTYIFQVRKTSSEISKLVVADLKIG